MAISALMGIEDGVDDDALASNIINEAREGARRVELALEDYDEDDL